MKHWVWIILLLPFSPLFAKDMKLEGYVLNAAAFRKIQSYCIDTRNLPPREEKVIEQFVSHESKPAGLLARLPWNRLASCQQGDLDAIVRVEFPYRELPTLVIRHDINGVLLVFRAGSPSPVYEAREVLMTGGPVDNDGGFATDSWENDALYYVVRILIHDWQKLSGTLAAATS